MDREPQRGVESSACLIPRRRRDIWFYRSLFLLLLLVIPALLLLYQAFWDENSSFLPFQQKSEWVFHPVQEIEDAFHPPVSKPVSFYLDFPIAEDLKPPGPCLLELRAFRSVQEVRINGKEVVPEKGRVWKQSSKADLTDLIQPGLNTLQIVVANPKGIPGLMVEEPPMLRTPGNWIAVLDFEARRVVSARQKGPPEPLDEMVGQNPGPLGQWLSEMRLTQWVWLWLTVWGGLTLLVAIQLWRGKLERPPKAGAWSQKYGKLTAALLLGLGLLLSLSNAFRYEAERSPFDFDEHVEYIEHVSDVSWIPSSSDGFQMYQPPLYYWLSALVRGGAARSLKPVQLLGAVAGWTLALVTWLLACRLLPASSACRLIALLFGLCVPVVLYMSPVVSNEVFSAALASLAFYWLVRIERDVKPSWRILLAGALAGLAMLSKYPALFVLSAGFFLFLGNWSLRRNSNSWRVLAAYTGTAILLCGWFYARNALQYGDPFVMAGDQASGFWYVQQPTYRTADFYYSFGSSLFQHPERAPWLSFWDGHYASFWGDLFRVSLDAGDERGYFWLGVALLLAFAPSCAILLGLLRSLRDCWLRPLGGVEWLLLAVPVWTWLALVAYSIEFPFVSVIKAFFFLFLIPVLGVHLARGRLLFYGLFRASGWVHDLAFLTVCGISIHLYWL